MRQRTAFQRGSARVIPMERTGIKPKARIECGVIVDAEGNGTGVYVETHGRMRFTAEQAESFAADVQNFVYECRNGGKLA
jgi:hypothetical protein